MGQPDRPVPAGLLSVDREALVEQVLDLVESVPPGRVTTYGALADAVGFGGPRWVGHVLSTHGAAVPWWRVVRSDGGLPPSHREAVRHYRAEGTPLRAESGADTARVDVRRCGWFPAQPAPEP